MKIDRKDVFEKCYGNCAYCGQQLKFKGFQVDHLYSRRLGARFPKSIKGGINCFKNLMPSCRKCNNFKGAMSLEDFRSELGKQIERLKKNAQFDRALRFNQVQITESPIVFYFEKIYESRE